MKRRKKESRTVPITIRALLQRINRKLAREQRRLKVSRGREELRHFGQYYVLDGYGVERGRVNVENLGRELGVLKPWQHLAKAS